MKRGADRSPEHNNKHNLVLGKTKEVFVGVFSFLSLSPPLSLSLLILRVESVTTQPTDLCFCGNRISLCRSRGGLERLWRRWLIT